VNPDPLHNQDVVIIGALGLICLLALCVLSNAEPITAISMIGIYTLGAGAYWQYRRKVSSKAATPHNQSAEDVIRIASKLVDALPQAVAIIDKNNIVLHANSSAGDLAEIKEAGQPLASYIENPGIDQRLSRALAGYRPDPLMIHIEEPREQYIRLFFSSARQFGDDEAVSLTFVIFDDVTEIKVEEQRRADFLANASHELKTPIASLMGYIETLRGHAKDDPAAQERFLAIMQSQAERTQN